MTILDSAVAITEGLRFTLAERAIVLDHELGRGGMSVVYLAHDLRHDRPVAVKVLGPGVLGGNGRFLREIKTLSPLVHPNIVPLFDSGEADGQPFFVMPYIEGESLRRRLQESGPLDVADAVRIAGEVGEALAFAHAHGILHRDIKPENILFQAGHAVVTDFGVARARGRPEDRSGERVTDQGLVLGTAEYMSPEQASGDPEVDERTDIYSLGCVLYEMLAGAPPFSGANPQEILARRFRGGPPPLREARPEVSPELATIVERAMAPDPADRFATAADFLAALRAPAGVASPSRRPPRGWRQVRRTFGVVGAGALVALAMQDTGHARLDPRRVVVARLSNETGDSALSYVSALASDHLTASLARHPGIVIVTSATIMPSRVNPGLKLDSLDDPARLRGLAQETAAGTVVSGSYFLSDGQLSFRAEITDANHGTLLSSVGPVTSRVNRPEAAIDSLGWELEAAVHRQVQIRIGKGA